MKKEYLEPYFDEEFLMNAEEEYYARLDSQVHKWEQEEWAAEQWDERDDDQDR